MTAKIIVKCIIYNRALNRFLLVQRCENDHTGANTWENAGGNIEDGFEIFHVESYDEYREIMDRKLLEQQKDFEEIDGVTAQELLKFVGKNGYYYLPVFKDIRRAYSR